MSSSSSDDDLPPPPTQSQKSETTPHKGGFLSNVVRGLVSKKKLRFTKDGYDLDLSYITKRIIAMGFPSVGKEAAYRNRLDHVQSFFKQYHPFTFKVYNLCHEKPYDAKVFVNADLGGAHGYFPFDDHNPCHFELLLAICKDFDAFLNERKENVIAVHCKAGKGRTGTVIAAYLLYCGMAKTADEALNFFGQKRTKNNKGVTIPSQQRFVRYMEEYLHLKQPLYKQVVLDAFIFTTAPHFDVDGGCDPYFIVSVNDKVIYNMKKDKKRKVRAFHPSETRREIGNIDLALTGNVKITFKDYDFMSDDDKMFTFWFHTAFLHKESYKFIKLNLDKACKDKKHKFFDQNFSLEVRFREITDHRDKANADVNTIYFIPQSMKGDNKMQTLLEEKEDADEDDEEELDDVAADNSWKQQMIRAKSDQVSVDALEHVSDDDEIPPPPPPVSQRFTSLSYIPPAPTVIPNCACTACGYANDEGARFCGECGVPILSMPPPVEEEVKEEISWDTVVREKAISFAGPAPVVIVDSDSDEVPATIPEESEDDLEDDLPPPPNRKAPAKPASIKTDAQPVNQVRQARAPSMPPTLDDESSEEEENENKTAAPSVKAPKKPISHVPAPEPVAPMTPCHFCGMGIDGEILQVGDDQFHTDCFRCFDCDLPLVGNMLHVKNHYYHPECLRCGFCSVPLANQPFKFDVEEKKPFCGKHAAKSTRTTEKCFRCKLVLRVNAPAVSAGGKKYHVACLTCSACKESLVGKPMAVRDQHLLCESCVNAPGSSMRCAACAQGIEGQCFEVGEPVLAFHPACFKCKICDLDLTKNPFVTGTNALYCATHAGQK